MRSSPFLLFSITLHIAAVGALALSPKKLMSLLPQKGAEIEVSVGAPAEQPGLAEPEVVQEEVPAETAPAPTPAPAPKAKAPEKAEPAVTQAKALAKIKAKSAPKAKASVAALLKREVAKPAETTPDTEATPAETAPAETDSTETAAATHTESPAKETAEAATATENTGSEGTEETSEKSTEATAPEAEAEDPAPVGWTEQKGDEARAGGNTDSEADHGPKGGATKQGAISYLGLKQMQGNKAPAYPMEARVERRQGQLELVYRVTAEGDVTDISIAKSSGHSDLDEAAVDAVSKFKFYPGQEGWARHPITFALKGPDEAIPSKLRTGKQADIQ